MASLALIRKTTGTLVQGKIAISVTTAVTRSGGVTSYSRFKGVNLLLSFQLFKGDGFSELSMTVNLSGSSKKYANLSTRCNISPRSKGLSEKFAFPLRRFKK